MKKLTLFTAILMTANMVFAQVINIPADYPTIQQGIDAAGDGDTVLVHPGTYYENVYLTDKSLTLASLFLTTHDTSYVSQTVIDAEGSGSVISSIYNFSNVRISGMTITGGGSSGIWFLTEPNNVMIDHVIITGNSGDYWGAGVTIWGGTDIQFHNVTISNNSHGYYGGGVCCMGSSPIFENCFFTDNNAAYGGGVCCMGSSPIFENCFFTDNNAAYGGAVYCSGSNPVFRNVVFTGNNMNNYFTYGSVLYMSSGNNPCFPALINCTMTGNNVWLENGYSGIIDCVRPCSSNVTVINSVSWHNGVWVNKYGADYLNHSTISYTNVGRYVMPGEGNISVEPLFHGTGAHPYQLSPGSPCIDAGTPDTTGLSLPLMDLLGNYRIWDGDGDGIERIDMGAYEFDAPIYVGMPQSEIANPKSEIQIFPNPFTNHATIEFNLPQTTMVSIQIFNAMGAKVAELHYGQLPAGQQQFTWHAGDLPKGLYFCRVRMGNESTTQKLIKY